MGWLLPVTLSCISLLSLLLPGALSRSPSEHPLLVRLRKPPDRQYPQDLTFQAVQNKEPVALGGQGESHPELLVELHPLRSHRHHQHRVNLRVHRGKGRGQGPRRARGRGRRHTRRHHTQLMRMGCSFSTCQLQNLSHRLRHFLGQSGKKESAPVNLTSPHSYG
ncbi:protein ADM2 [Sarcophilus harrisii]|uniref:Adrenomedullin 2 n=1 Tax=Sarcophilus harrisii TaxID=9305 RepID=A0A7N4UZN4_SARHA|nr:protein ADM2 [Sarcophilus harrisii]